MFAKGFLYFLFVCFGVPSDHTQPKGRFACLSVYRRFKLQLELLPKPISKGQIIFSRCNDYGFDYRGSVVRILAAEILLSSQSASYTNSNEVYFLGGEEVGR
jgi:hypothetical protein